MILELNISPPSCKNLALFKCYSPVHTGSLTHPKTEYQRPTREIHFIYFAGFTWQFGGLRVEGIVAQIFITGNQ